MHSPLNSQVNLDLAGGIFGHSASSSLAEGGSRGVCGPTQFCYRFILQLSVACPHDFHGAGSKSAEICPSGDLPDKLQVPAVMCQPSPSCGPAAEQGAVLILAAPCAFPETCLC